MNEREGISIVILVTLMMMMAITVMVMVVMVTACRGNPNCRPGVGRPSGDQAGVGPRSAHPRSGLHLVCT